jgi:hypothetical protein
MASERQIAANRRNARKSTGPRSGAGRKRASRNAYRHGLTLSINSTAAFAKQLDTLVRKIAGDSEDAIVLERARAIAQARRERLCPGRMRQVHWRVDIFQQMSPSPYSPFSMTRNR